MKFNTLLVAAFLIFGCKIKYSFTGASVPADAKTISVQYFPNNSSQGPGTLSAQFTEALKDRFTSRTNLKWVETSGDLALEGYIASYSPSPAGITGNETVSLNRLTISVYVKFTNSKDEKQSFETTFSRYADYDSQLQLTAIEEDLIKQINAQLVDDIFNKAVVNW